MAATPHKSTPDTGRLGDALSRFRLRPQILAVALVGLLGIAIVTGTA